MSLVQYQPPQSSDRPARWVDLMAPVAELAKAVAATEFVPKALRQNPAGIAAAILYGDEVGLGPMQSLARISVIEGKPTLAAETQRALILAAGHQLWLEEFTTQRVTWAGRRRGEDTTARVTWSMDDARRANLAGRPSWRAYPRAMLSARASADLARAIFADVIGGMAATEEFEDGGPELEQTSAGADAIDAPAGTSKRRRRQTVKAVATVSGGTQVEAPPLPPLPGEPDQPAASRAQLNRILGRYRDLGLGARDQRPQRLEHASRAIGRMIGSSNDLTADEADRLLAQLEAETEGEREAPSDDETNS
jgi:hypothetical protein